MNKPVKDINGRVIYEGNIFTIDHEADSSFLRHWDRETKITRPILKVENETVFLNKFNETQQIIISKNNDEKLITFTVPSFKAFVNIPELNKRYSFLEPSKYFEISFYDFLDDYFLTVINHFHLFKKDFLSR